MNNRAIRAALEARLKALDIAFPTAWPNTNIAPSGAFQSPDILFAEPDDRGFRDSPIVQRGIFVITLLYPTNTGPGAAETKAEAIRNHFYRGLSLATTENFSVVIDRTPELTGGGIEDDYFVIRVRCRFYAYIGTENL